MTTLEKEMMTELNNNLINTKEKLLMKIDEIKKDIIMKVPTDEGFTELEKEVKELIPEGQVPDIKNIPIKQLEDLEKYIEKNYMPCNINEGYSITTFRDYFKLYLTHFDFCFWEDENGDVSEINVDTQDTFCTGSRGFDYILTYGLCKAYPELLEESNFTGFSDVRDEGITPPYRTCTINGWEKIENPLLRRFFRNQESLYGEVLYIVDEEY